MACNDDPLCICREHHVIRDNPLFSSLEFMEFATRLRESMATAEPPNRDSLRKAAPEIDPQLRSIKPTASSSAQVVCDAIKASEDRQSLRIADLLQSAVQASRYHSIIVFETFRSHQLAEAKASAKAAAASVQSIEASIGMLQAQEFRPLEQQQQIHRQRKAAHPYRIAGHLQRERLQQQGEAQQQQQPQQPQPQVLGDDNMIPLDPHRRLEHQQSEGPPENRTTPMVDFDEPPLRPPTQHLADAVLHRLAMDNLAQRIANQLYRQLPRPDVLAASATFALYDRGSFKNIWSEWFEGDFNRQRPSIWSLETYTKAENKKIPQWRKGKKSQFRTNFMYKKTLVEEPLKHMLACGVGPGVEELSRQLRDSKAKAEEDIGYHGSTNNYYEYLRKRIKQAKEVQQ
ncbi:hypothetical protein BGZ97_002428 [Linnemannia gamsii]|uniref:Uncharacterized protein n=1 Tax=Linnemannia gamsii TaxID=64522 RepID=A0A9P6QYR2_9FUNG|nr:hypothetical protein BGZ97_002428 [Linnemannia gamsii]